MGSFEDEKVKKEKSTSEAHTHFAVRVTAGSKLPTCVTKNGLKHVSCFIYFLWEIYFSFHNHHNLCLFCITGYSCVGCWERWHQKGCSFHWHSMLWMFLRPKTCRTFKEGIWIWKSSHAGFDFRKASRTIVHPYIRRSSYALFWIHFSDRASSTMTMVSLWNPGLVSFTSTWRSIGSMGGDWYAVATVQLVKGNTKCKLVTVGTKSYHELPSTLFGLSCPLFTKLEQIMYPVPAAGKEFNKEALLMQFQEFF